MISRIVKVVVCFAVASLTTGAVGACTAQVEPEQSPDRSSDPIGQVEQALQLPNCDQGVGGGSGSRPIMGAGRDNKGEAQGQCKIGTFYMTWQCVRMPNGQIVPQNVMTSTDFCSGQICIPGSPFNPGAPTICYPGFICC